MKLPIGLLTGALLVAAAPVAAQDVKTLSVHNDWTAYSFKENKRQVCYMAARPTKSEGVRGKRGDVFAIVTHRPSEGSFGVFSFIAGYPLKEGKPVALDVGTKPYSLTSHGETAWASTDDDKNLLASMKSAKAMIIQATAAKGGDSRDNFSLNGFAQALEAISRACPRAK
ncbi:MAG: invasion associated locus B family protein [Alphaproteobacteria bacterium]